MESADFVTWQGSLIPATDELTDSEILDRYGALMWCAVSAFRQDPSYIVEMAESAASLRARRANRQLLKQAS